MGQNLGLTYSFTFLPWCANHVVVLLFFNMLALFSVQLRKPKVYQVDFILFKTSHKVLRLDVAMNVIILMQKLQTSQSLIENHENSFQGEDLLGHLHQQLIEILPKQCLNYKAVSSILNKVEQSWESGCTIQLVQNLSLIPHRLGQYCVSSSLQYLHSIILCFHLMNCQI